MVPVSFVEKKNLQYKVSLHRFPKKQEACKKWLRGLSLTENDTTTKYFRVYSMNFCDGNPGNIPSHSVGAKFAAQPNIDSEHNKRAQNVKLHSECAHHQPARV